MKKYLRNIYKGKPEPTMEHRKEMLGRATKTGNTFLKNLATEKLLELYALDKLKLAPQQPQDIDRPCHGCCLLGRELCPKWGKKYRCSVFSKNGTIMIYQEVDK